MDWKSYTTHHCLPAAGLTLVTGENIKRLGVIYRYTYKTYILDLIVKQVNGGGEEGGEKARRFVCTVHY